MGLTVDRAASQVLAVIRIKDDAGAAIPGLLFSTAGLSADYKLPSAAVWTSIPLSAGAIGAWSEGGFIENAGGDGWYQLGLPDAAISPGETTQLRIKTAGAEFRYGAISAIGGEGDSLTILPGVVRQSELQEGSRLRVYLGQTAPVVASVYDSAELPIDLSTKVLEFRIARADGREWISIPNASITVIGADLNTITFDPPAELTAAAGLFPWSLRDSATVLGSGELEVIFAA